MQIFINIISDVIQIIKLVLTCELFFLYNKRKQNIIRYSAVLIIITCLSIVVSSYRYSLVGEAACFICFSLVFIILYKEKIGKLFISMLWIVIIVSLIDKISLILADTIIDILSIEIININIFLMHGITSIFILITGFLLRKQNSSGIKDINILQKIVFMILTLIDVMVYVSLSDLAIEAIQINEKIPLRVVFVMLGIGMYIQIVMCLLLMASKNIYKEKEEIASKYLNAQTEHYKYLEQREEETRKFRHDIKSHMYILEALYKENKYEEYDAYWSEISEKFDSFRNEISVNNGIVDAILNKYASDAKKYGIKLDVKGHMPVLCYIEAFDLCTIFSNLLSNAVNAERFCKGKIIYVVCKYTDKEIIIYIENNYSGELKYEGEKILSIKEDSKMHGYGLQNVYTSVKKYNGHIDINTDDKKFKITLILKNKEM